MVSLNDERPLQTTHMYVVCASGGQDLTSRTDQVVSVAGYGMAVTTIFRVTSLVTVVEGYGSSVVVRIVRSKVCVTVAVACVCILRVITGVGICRQRQAARISVLRRPLKYRGV